MSDNIESLVLEHLRHIRDKVDQMADEKHNPPFIVQSKHTANAILKQAGISEKL